MEPVKGGKLASPSPEVQELFRTYDPAASPASWAIRFAASLEQVIMVLSGMSTPEQVRDNTAYMADFRPLTDKEQDMVMEAADLIRGDGTVPCTACSYCTGGCPSHLPIPTTTTISASRTRRITKGPTGLWRSIPTPAFTAASA